MRHPCRPDWADLIFFSLLAFLILVMALGYKRARAGRDGPFTPAPTNTVLETR